MSGLLERLNQALAGRYSVESEIGRGGMATVFLAEDLRHRRKVAIKVLHPELATYIGADRFLREIEVLAGLSHPHILPLHDSGKADDLLYYVMPYAEGESLRDRLEREDKVPLLEAVKIVREVAAALQYSHEHDVVHRDVKPENIMLSGGIAVVADFGIAKETAPAGEEGLTATGLALGTPVYMSPEQAAGGRHVDGRTDQYALATVLYEMLAGQPPFIESTPQSVLRRKSLESVQSLRALDASIPPGVDAALGRGLVRDPADRFDSISDFADALEAGVGTARRSKWWWVAAAAGVLLVAALAATIGRSMLGGSAPADRVTLVVATPEVGDADPVLGDVVRIGLERSLLASDHAVPAGSLETALALEAMGLGPDARLDEATALEVAERTGSAGAVLASLDRVGTGFVLTASIAMPDGERTSILQRQVSGEDALLFALDTLAGELRAQLGESRRELRESPSLVYLLTPSIEALRLVARARAAKADYDRALPLLRQAVAIDSTFAWAWEMIAMIEQNRLGDYLAPAERAWDLVDHLAPYQQRQNRMTRLLMGTRDMVAAIELGREAIANPSPDARADPDIDFPQYFHVELNLAHLEVGDPTSARDGYLEWRRLVAEEGEYDPDPETTAINLSMALYRVGYAPAARAELNRFGELTGWGALAIHAIAPAAGGEWDEAAAIAVQGTEEGQHPLLQTVGHRILGTIEAVRGRPESSRTSFARVLEVTDAADVNAVRLEQAQVEFFALADQARGAASLLPILAADRPTVGLARRGHARAQAMAAAICAHMEEPPVEGPLARLDCGASIVTDSLHDELETLEALGWRAVAQGRLEDAVRIGREPILSRAGGQGLRARAPAAFAYESLGMPDSARAIYEPMAEAPYGWISNAASAIVMRSYALRRLARMGGAAGDWAIRVLHHDWEEAEPAFLERIDVPPPAPGS